jgi:hypothetical protein
MVSGVASLSSPLTVVSVLVVRLSTATPLSNVEMVRSWLGSATSTVRTIAGLCPPPPPPPDAAGASGSGAAVTADTVPSLGTATHRLLPPSNTPPVMPGG